MRHLLKVEYPEGDSPARGAVAARVSLARNPARDYVAAAMFNPGRVVKWRHT
jgi:hypothetical protein